MDLAASYGPVAESVEATTDDLVARDALARLTSFDHTLWQDDPTEVADRLGWLPVAGELAGPAGDEIDAFVASVHDVDHVVLLGMGGSSLFPEVVSRLAGARSRQLHVLDTTHPDTLSRLVSALDPGRTLVVAASKSGGTIETASHLAWMWQRFDHDPSRFVAITDPGTPFDDLATERSFRHVFRNRPDIGGRYSALSMFGLVPAALLGRDWRSLAHGGAAGPDAHAVSLAAAMAGAAKAGRYALTVVHGPSMAPLGVWIEQLVAESTGKHGVGVLPIVDESPTDPDAYDHTRLFVATGDDVDHDHLDALARAGHPVVRLTGVGPADLGALVLLWESATAMAGASLGINPFDQPDVAAAKAATAEALEHGLPDITVDDPATVLDGLAPGDYVSICAFVDPGGPLPDVLEQARTSLRDRYRVPVTLGYGPRYLHSTGQCHKGGPPVGRFLQVVDSPTSDHDVPGQPFSLATLIAAQAAGDLTTLRRRGRPAARVSVDALVP